MLNKNSLNNFSKCLNIQNSIKPDYKQYCFSNIIPTINYLLTNEKVDNMLPKDCFISNDYPKKNKVILFFIDAYGWLFWDVDKGAQYPEFIKLRENDIKITPITAIFPSSTAAAVNSINYGCNPTRHGIFDVRMYFTEFDKYLWTFNFEPVVDNKEAFKAEGNNISNMYFKKNTNWEMLKEKNVNSYSFYPKKLIKSDFNINGSRGSMTEGYETLSEGLTNLKIKIENTDKGLYYFYIESIDVLMHKYGTTAPQTTNEILSFWDCFNNVFGDWDKPNDTTFLFTADHGQINTDPKNAFLLNEKIKNFDNYLKTTKSGSIIYPVGSSRSSFLFVKKDLIHELYKTLTKELVNIAVVLTTNDYIKSGLIEDINPSQEFIQRLGDIQIIPLDNNLVWYKKDGITKEKPGAHGGVSKDEMLTQVIVW